MLIQLFVGSWTPPCCVRHLRKESFILEESVEAVVRCKLKIWLKFFSFLYLYENYFGSKDGSTIIPSSRSVRTVGCFIPSDCSKRTFLIRRTQNKRGGSLKAPWWALSLERLDTSITFNLTPQMICPHSNVAWQEIHKGIPHIVLCRVGRERKLKASDRRWKRKNRENKRNRRNHWELRWYNAEDMQSCPYDVMNQLIEELGLEILIRVRCLDSRLYIYVLLFGLVDETGA